MKITIAGSQSCISNSTSDQWDCNSSSFSLPRYSGGGEGGGCLEKLSPDQVQFNVRQTHPGPPPVPAARSPDVWATKMPPTSTTRQTPQYKTARDTKCPQAEIRTAQALPSPSSISPDEPRSTRWSGTS